MDKIKVKNGLSETLKEFLLSVLAGMSISFGCVAFLASGNKIVGALFFVVGLFMILNFGFSLYTGKVCYAFDNKPKYIARLLLIWFGNVVGAILMALMVGATRLTSLHDAVLNVVNTKLEDNVLSLFFLGVFCNMLIFVAVHGYKNFENPLAKMVALFFGVSVFVLCGFEHCIADAFYFAFAGSYTFKTLLYLLMITLGNTVGGLFFPLLLKAIKGLNKEKKE